ncbi:MAG: hypothetical protein HEQ35_17740 [Gloeotrichia echinulata IR180]|jgi:hypothetical protein|nr:hypothetical protein [Gloeotrichia echinulata DEX184]
MSTLTLSGTVDLFDSEIEFEKIENFLPAIQQQAAHLIRVFISFCQTVYVEKMTTDAKQWRSTNESLGWATSTATPYAKVGEYFVEVNPYNLELLDIKTLFALCAEKYSVIIERLKTERLTVAEVRSQMSSINKASMKPKEAPKALEWRRAKTGERWLRPPKASLIARLDAETGEALEQKYKSSCLPLPLFIRDLLRQWQPQSHPIPVESTERWRHGWNVGVMVVPNDVGAKNFIDWFENKPAEVIECDGSLLTVQFLKLRRHDGDICQLAYGNWVEENQ